MSYTLRNLQFGHYPPELLGVQELQRARSPVERERLAYEVLTTRFGPRAHKGIDMAHVASLALTGDRMLVRPMVFDPKSDPDGIYAGFRFGLMAAARNHHLTYPRTLIGQIRPRGHAAAELLPQPVMRCLRTGRELMQVTGACVEVSDVVRHIVPSNTVGGRVTAYYMR